MFEAPMEGEASTAGLVQVKRQIIPAGTSGYRDAVE